MKFIASICIAFCFLSISTYANNDRSDKDVAQVINTAKGKIFAKYNSLLIKNPTLEGMLVIKINISKDGSLINCDTNQSSIPSAELKSYACDIFSSLNFGESNQHEHIYLHKIDLYTN